MRPCTMWSHGEGAKSRTACVFQTDSPQAGAVQVIRLPDLSWIEGLNRNFIKHSLTFNTMQANILTIYKYLLNIDP